MTAPNLSKIEPQNPLEMRFTWETGELYSLPYQELRFHCPCAGCIDEHTGERIVRRETIDASIRPLAAESIGRYAIALRWSDQHSTGIYPYDRLYDLCQKLGQKLEQ
jgi:DUF971 family protein